MKIGIITYSYGYNFGGVLQCYALQEALKELGYHDVHIVNCIPNKLKFYLGGIPRRRELRTFYDLYLRLRHGKKCKKAFDDFRIKYLKMTLPLDFNEVPAFVKDFHALIVGSDQIWNFREQKNGLFFLSWKPAFRGLKIAYAPCCGKNEVLEKSRESLKCALNSFNSLSVRNEETQQFVMDITGMKPQIVPDPTCIFDFNKIEVGEPLIKEKYIFVYILGNEIKGGNNAAIDLLKKKMPGRKIIASVIAYSNPQKTSWADNIAYDLSPIEWLNYIKYADFVLTDSFHGTIFSMKYERPFITYYSEERRKSRFIGLINQFRIGENVVSDVTQIENCNIQPRCFDTEFSALEEVGKKYLVEALTKKNKTIQC